MNNENGLVQPDSVSIDSPPLYLPVSDQTILQTLDYAEARGKTVRQKLGIDARANRNIEFWKGNQVDKTKLDARFQEMHVDNVVRQNLENKIKLATGRIPDIFAAPPDSQDFNKDAARNVQAYLRDRLTSSTNKRLLKNGLRKLDLNLIAIIKCLYDKETQRSKYELVDPKNILFGEGSMVPEDGFTIDGTDVLFHYVEEPTQVVLNKFPDKAQELMQQLAVTMKEIPSRIVYTEASFRWYDEKGKANEGVCWRYGTVLLGKMKHPYFDHDNPQVNYFDKVQKNFILFSYSNLGESVYETTTDFEQGIAVNRIINRRRRQITEINDRAVPKLVFLGGTITKTAAESISSSPQEGILLDNPDEGVDDVRKAIYAIPATTPSPMLYNDMVDLRGRLDSMFSTHGTVRGEQQGGPQSGVSKQITREGDLVTSDDIVDITIERVLYEMACWEMQFLRLFHDDDRPPYRVTNSEGETENIEMRRKTIETDLQVVVKSSSNDKATRRADALQMLTAKAIDPYNLMLDLDINNPRERMRQLMAFIKAQQTGDYSGYMDAIGVNMDSAFATEDDAQRDIDILRTGNQVMVKLPGEKYVSTFLALMKSPDFHDPTQFDELARTNIMAHIQRLKRLVDDELAKRQQTAGVDSQGLQQQQQPGGPETASAFSPPGPVGQMAQMALAQRQGAPAA